MQNVLTLETNKYAIKLDNFEGPLDLLCHLIDKNKMDICDINLSQITDQYMDLLNEMERLNLEIASEFLVMASTLLYIKSKNLLPTDAEDESELTEEELLRRIIEYKRYKEITKTFKEQMALYSQRCFKRPDQVELPKQKLEKAYDKTVLSTIYEELVEKNASKINQNAKNIEKLAITETYSVGDKVKEMFRELIRKKKFVFNSLFSLQKCNKAEVVTAFSGVLEMSRRNKVITSQDKTFGDILVEKSKQKENK